MPTENKCLQCGKPVSPDALMGLCPDCMLKAGLSSGATTGPGSTPVPVAPPPSPAELARYFPQLEILELLGRGGMGAVYKARQKQLDRLVALKILPPNISHDPAFADRFAREAKALAKLNHPNIVTLYEFGQVSNAGVTGEPPAPLFYFLMEFVDGVNLRQLFNVGRIAPREALAIVPQICDALQYAHDHGIVYRDIKPENILLDRAGHVKVADFGLAKLVGGNEEPLTRPSDTLSQQGGEKDGVRDKAEANLTGAHVLGTPQYMAPEQVKHPQDVDHRADIYSLGVVFYQMLTGELPGRRIEPPSSRMRGIQIDVRLDEVVLRALEKEPERRYQQASVLKTEVETIASGEDLGHTAAAASPGDLASSRSCICYISSLEHVRSFFGSCIYIYEGKGTIHLSAEELAFSHPRSPIHIPLCSIRDLHIGHYSRLAKPARLDYISVTYEEAGNTRTRLFTPSWSGLTPTWITNRLVADWFNAIQAAVRKTQGATIAVTPQSTADVPAATSPSVEEARRQVKGPAIGVFIAGCLDLAMIVLVLFSKPELIAELLPPKLSLVPLVALLFIPSVIIIGASQMRRLASYGLAIAASILAIILVPGALIGLPFGIWSLFVLMRPEVRGAFKRNASFNESLSGSGSGWKIVAGVVAAVMLFMAISVGVLFLTYVKSHRAVSSQSVSDFVVRGVVTDAITGKAIIGARVDDNRYGAGPSKAPQQAWADANGRYELRTSYEEHTIAASAPGYETKLATLFTKTFGKEKEVRMDFSLQPTTGSSALSSGPLIKQTSEAEQNANQEIARLNLQHAEQEVKEAEAKVSIGLLTEYELQEAKSSRDVLAAEVKGDNVEVARLKLAIAESDLDVVGKKLSVGKATTQEYEQAKLARDTEKIRYKLASLQAGLVLTGKE